MGRKTGLLIGGALAAGGLALVLAKSVKAGPPKEEEVDGELLSAEWQDDNGQWRHISDPMPEEDTFTHRYLVKNTGPQATFKIGIFHEGGPFGDYWSYSPELALASGQQGYIYWELWSGPAKVVVVTFHLFANDIEVDEMTVTVNIVASAGALA